ncbi:MAG: sulfatase-like hydrolase/transferase [Verrucomicrobia bacterium]|nr:sulfatase-like hydrolase/transferase [Verrucomicrobiota bacterium]
MKLSFRMFPLVCWSICVAFAASVISPAAELPRKPNILWITAEDMSPNLGCYGDAYARTPHLDRFARQSVRYTQAFATAPVCSPARSTLITGVYATSLGTQRLRSEFPIPAHFKGFPAYLRAAGYFCSNNVKTDYNIANEQEFIREAWDESSPKAHWRQRKPGQPFFSVFNIMTTHQSRTSVWPEQEFERMIGQSLRPDERQDPAQAPLPPFYPDTPAARKTWARYHDCITAMDKEAAGLLRQLDEDGLAEDTIVFFYSDHGMGLPRGKRLLHDSGLRVPLLVRFPKKFQHFAPAAAGQTVDRLVSFVDFAPTVLSLAGVPIPIHMRGCAFLGSAAGKPREYVHGARDRVDEAFELSRSVRDSRFLYIRNYMPHVSWNQPEGFSDASELRREITRLAQTGKLNAAQLTYAAPRKALEELYDSQTDPHQIQNLADSTPHRGVLERMRKLSHDWILETRDAGFLTEQEAWKRCGGSTPFEIAKNSRQYPLERLLEAAEWVGRPAASKQIRLLADADSGVRYWAAVGLHASGNDAASARTALLNALRDESSSVRIEAAAALVEQGATQTAVELLTRELRGRQLESVLQACRTLQLMGEKARPALPMMKEHLAAARKSEGGHPHWLFIRFSLEAAVQQLEGGVSSF